MTLPPLLRKHFFGRVQALQERVFQALIGEVGNNSWVAGFWKCTSPDKSTSRTGSGLSTGKEAKRAASATACWWAQCLGLQPSRPETLALVP